MAIPVADLERLESWCSARIPAHVADRVKVFWTRRGNTVTVVESSLMGDDWLDVPVARIKYVEGLGGVWTLYWFDRDSRAHLYDSLNPQRQLARVLREIDRDPTCIFWG